MSDTRTRQTAVADAPPAPHRAPGVPASAGEGRPFTREERLALIEPTLAQRILVIDGAMGTLIQSYQLDEAGFRGERFRDHHRDVRGDNELVTLSQPHIVRAIHDAYLEAGADLIETNTFNANRISQRDYDLGDVARDMNREAARIAREAADAAERREPGRPRWVGGALGPTNRTASISPDVTDPSIRNVTWEELAEAYQEAAAGLIEGGADILVIETVFDTLNAKAAIFGVQAAFDELGERRPIIVSGTIVDASGRTLSGQTVEAFWNSVAHADPIIVGLNCALGARQLREYVQELGRVAPIPVSAYPNAGLPNEFGGYDETPDVTAEHLGAWARDGLVNLAGGCCGRPRPTCVPSPRRLPATRRASRPSAPSRRASAASSHSRFRPPAACSSTSASGRTSPAPACSRAWSPTARSTRRSRSPGSRSIRAPR